MAKPNGFILVSYFLPGVMMFQSQLLLLIQLQQLSVIYKGQRDRNLLYVLIPYVSGVD
jgi:hypothetical protein